MAVVCFVIHEVNEFPVAAGGELLFLVVGQGSARERFKSVTKHPETPCNPFTCHLRVHTACFIALIGAPVFFTVILSHPCPVTADTGRPRQFVAPQFFFVARGSGSRRVHLPAEDSLSDVWCRTQPLVAIRECAAALSALTL